MNFAVCFTVFTLSVFCELANRSVALTHEGQTPANHTYSETTYVSSLDEASIARAKVELNEDQRNRDRAVETLRTWIKEQSWLKSPTDTGFLLRFLRIAKFSQLEARQAIVNYWTTRTTNKLWFSQTDPRDDKIQAMLDTGFILRLPRTDTQGRVYLMFRASALDSEYIKKKYGIETLFRTVICFLDLITMDERTQVNGVVFIADMTGYTLQHSLLYTAEDIMKLINTIQHVYPLRLKSMHIYNGPPIFEAVLKIMKPFKKQKLKVMLNIIGKNLDPLYDKVDMSVLPREYLPDNYNGINSGPVKVIVEQIKRDIIKPEVVEHITKLTDGGYGVDLKLKPADQ